MTYCPKFSLGETNATPGFLKAISESGESPSIFLDRHASADWGDISKEDAKKNEKSLKKGLRIRSEYETSKGVKLWVITKGDRSSTTIMLPSEYESQEVQEFRKKQELN